MTRVRMSLLNTVFIINGPIQVVTIVMEHSYICIPVVLIFCRVQKSKAFKVLPERRLQEHTQFLRESGCFILIKTMQPVK